MPIRAHDSPLLDLIAAGAAIGDLVETALVAGAKRMVAIEDDRCRKTS